MIIAYYIHNFFKEFVHFNSIIVLQLTNLIRIEPHVYENFKYLLKFFEDDQFTILSYRKEISSTDIQFNAKKKVPQNFNSAYQIEFNSNQKFIDNIDKRLLSEIRKNLSYNIEIEVDIFSKKVPINSSQLFSSYELFYDISISHPVLVLLFHRDKLYFDYCKKNSNFIFHSNRSIARTNLSQKTGTVENYESFNNDTLVGIRENLEYQAEAMIDRYIVAISDSDETIVSSIEYEKKNHVASQEKDKNNKSLWDRIF